MAPLRCPACDIALGEGDTNCRRCGLRVAPLPRRVRPPRSDGEGDRNRSLRLLPARSAGTRSALLHGALAGAAIDAAAAVLWVGAQLAGAGGRAVAGNALVVAVVALLIAALVQPGVRIRRWGPPEVLRDRLAATARRDPRQTALFAAAAVVAAGFLAAAALG